MPNCPMSTALGHLGRALTIPVRYNINVELKVQRPSKAVLSLRVIAGRGRRHGCHILRWVCFYKAPVLASGNLELSFIALANKWGGFGVFRDKTEICIQSRN